jgi:hypothetical protein
MFSITLPGSFCNRMQQGCVQCILLHLTKGSFQSGPCRQEPPARLPTFLPSFNEAPCRLPECRVCLMYLQENPENEQLEARPSYCSSSEVAPIKSLLSQVCVCAINRCLIPFIVCFAMNFTLFKIALIALDRLTVPCSQTADVLHYNFW